MIRNGMIQRFLTNKVERAAKQGNPITIAANRSTIVTCCISLSGEVCQSSPIEKGGNP